MDEKQKQELYEQFHIKVLRYINGQVNDYYLAEDLCSDVFLKIYEKIDTYDKSKAQLSTWIFTITRNKLIDYYRTRKITCKIDENLVFEKEDEDLCTPEQLELLASALNNLDERKRKIIVMHYYQKISLKDIANNLDISYVYTKVLHKTALDELKTLIK